MNKTDKEIIGKKEAVTRLIDTAIEMFFADMDSFSINLLVKSAYQVISDQMKRKYGDNYYGYARVKHLVEDDDYQGKVVKLFHEDASFAKHSDRIGDSEKEIEFWPDGVELFLGLAISEYCTLFGEATNNQKKFLQYLSYSKPEAMKEPYRTYFRSMKQAIPSVVNKETWRVIPAERFSHLESPRSW